MLRKHLPATSAGAVFSLIVAPFDASGSSIVGIGGCACSTSAAVVFPSSMSFSTFVLSAVSYTPCIASSAGAPDSVPTSCLTASTVAAGPYSHCQRVVMLKAFLLLDVVRRTPASAIKTLPSLFTTNTPLVVPFGAFLSPMAAIKLTDGSHNNV